MRRPHIPVGLWRVPRRPAAGVVESPREAVAVAAHARDLPSGDRGDHVAALARAARSRQGQPLLRGRALPAAGYLCCALP